MTYNKQPLPRGRRKATVKFPVELLVDLVADVDFGRIKYQRDHGSAISVRRFCSMLDARGGFHWIYAYDRAAAQNPQITSDMRKGQLGDRGGLMVRRDGPILLHNSIQNGDSLRRRYNAGKTFIRENGLTAAVNDRVSDLLGEPRDDRGWISPWMPGPKAEPDDRN
jgi:hypothetical protein